MQMFFVNSWRSHELCILNRSNSWHRVFYDIISKYIHCPLIPDKSTHLQTVSYRLLLSPHLYVFQFNISDPGVCDSHLSELHVHKDCGFSCLCPGLMILKTNNCWPMRRRSPSSPYHTSETITLSSPPPSLAVNDPSTIILLLHLNVPLNPAYLTSTNTGGFEFRAPFWLRLAYTLCFA